MAKMLEIIGLVLVSVMILGFVGALETFGIESGLTPLFWGMCRWNFNYNHV